MSAVLSVTIIISVIFVFVVFTVTGVIFVSAVLSVKRVIFASAVFSITRDVCLVSLVSQEPHYVTRVMFVFAVLCVIN